MIEFFLFVAIIYGVLVTASCVQRTTVVELYHAIHKLNCDCYACKKYKEIV